MIVVLMGLFLLAGCGGTAVSSSSLPLTAVTSRPSPTILFTPTATMMVMETAVFTPSPSPTTSPTPIPTQTPIPSPTPDLYQALTIESLAQRSYGGGELKIIETLEKNDTFTRYLITYPSDGLTIYGYMNVPNEGDNFPVVIMLHGYMPVAEYETVTYTKRYADDLAEAGYFVIHPNFRNHPPSDNGPNPFRIGYALDTLNLIALVREQSLDDFGVLRRANADKINLWGHSMGGGVALRVLAVLGEVDYLKTAVLYGSMSADELQNYEQIRIWRGGNGVDFELNASPAYLQTISPLNYLGKSKATIAVHHSFDDEVVPVAWSQQLCTYLDEIDFGNECFFYNFVPHTFRGGADEQFMERVRLLYDRENGD